MNMIKFKLNGAREKQTFYFRRDGELSYYRLSDGELPEDAFKYAKKKFGIKEIDKPKISIPKTKKEGDK